MLPESKKIAAWAIDRCDKKKGKDYQTCGIKEIGLIYGNTEESYRKTTALMNRVRHQEEVPQGRRLCEVTERENL